MQAIVADSGAGKAGAAPVSAPVLMLGMQVDVHVPHISLVGFEIALRRAHKPVDSHYYAGVGHVVTLTVPGGIAANATARAVAFFRRYVH